AKDRSGNELDRRVPRTQLAYAAGLGASLTSRSSLDATVGREDTQYDNSVSFRDVDIATRLNRRSTKGDLVLHANVSPLTQLFINAEGSRDEFTKDTSRGSDNLRGAVGLEFASDAIISGHASVGYHMMQPRGSDRTLAFDGWTTAVFLSYSLLGRTRFDGHLSRDTNYSVL